MSRRAELRPRLDQLRPRLIDGAFAAGWAAVPRMPRWLAAGAFDTVAAVSARMPGRFEQLRRNLRQVVGAQVSEADLERLVRRAVASYTRYWREAFQLPTMDPQEVGRRTQVVGWQNVSAALEQGRGAVIALTHSGNWDAAAVVLCKVQQVPMTTVAERLKPESLFEQFVAYRESLGFEIFPLSGGEQPPFGLLAERLRAGGIVCLLGERDIARHGVPVTFFGERTRMPAGSARLAIETGAALLPAHHWFEEAPFSRMSLDEPIDVSGGIESATQALADAFAVNIAAHPADWHMLQPLWESDWTERQRGRVAQDGTTT